MANNHTTLVSLFDDIADAIRELRGTSSNIVADTFPDKLREIMPCKLKDKYGITIPNISVATISPSFTPKCFYYYKGYYYVGGNDSSGKGIVARSSDLSSWSYINLKSGSNTSVNAIAFTSDSSWWYIFGKSTDARNPTRIKGGWNNTSWAGWQETIEATDAVSDPDSVYSWIMLGSKTTVYGDGSGTYRTLAHGSLTQNIYKCCAYKGYPVAISLNGYYTYKSSFSATSVSGMFKIADNFNSAVCAQMGDYLVIAGTKSDGTYLYYSNGTPGSMTFTASKILSTQVTPIGLAYANGLYVMAYMENNVLRFYATESLGNSHGITNLTATAIKNNTGIAMAANGNAMAILTKSGGKAVVGHYTVANE